MKRMGRLGVALVGVLAADDGLSLPEYRAAERVFQLLTQVAGRAGRNDPGRVLLQTWQPEHPVILAAADHDYRSFAQVECAHRRAAGYPPFRRLVRLGLSGPRLEATAHAAAQLAAVVARELAGPQRETQREETRLDLDEAAAPAPPPDTATRASGNRR